MAGRRLHGTQGVTVAIMAIYLVLRVRESPSPSWPCSLFFFYRQVTIAVMAGDPLPVDLGNRQRIVVVIMVRRTCGLYTGFCKRHTKQSWNVIIPHNKLSRRVGADLNQDSSEKHDCDVRVQSFSARGNRGES